MASDLRRRGSEAVCVVPQIRRSGGCTPLTWGSTRVLCAAVPNAPEAVQRMRPAIVRLREEFGPYPLAHARPFLEVEGRELVRVVQEQVKLERPLQLVVVRNHQLVLAETAERFQPAVDYGSDVIGRLRR